MNFSTLPINSILIAPDTMHTQIRQSIMQEKDGVMGLRILSISQFLSMWISDELPSMPVALFQMYNRVTASSLPLQNYQNIITNVDFLKECYQFLNTIHFWKITLTALPQKTTAQKELFSILSLFNDISTINYNKQKALEHIQDKTFNHVYIVDCFHSIEDDKIIQQLIKQGAHFISNPHKEVNKHFFYAVNKRQEVEAVAQYIISHHQHAQDIQMTLSDTAYSPLVQQIFSRYEIPFTILSKQNSSLLVKQCIALLQFALHPDSEHLMQCIDREIFASYQLNAMREYVQIFEHDAFLPFIHVHTLQKDSTLINEYNFAKLKKLEEEAAIQQKTVLPLIQPLLQNKDYPSIIPSVVTILQEYGSITNEEISTYKRIHSLLQDCYPFIHSEDDITFIIALLEDINSELHSSQLHGVLVHGLNQAVLPRNNHYLLGTTQTNYPSFQTKRGIFDESYYALLLAYPSMEERYAFHQQQLSTLLTTSDHLYCSYPLGTYEGKSLECALEIEQFMLHEASLPYPLQVNYIEVLPQNSIKQESAKQLLSKDGILHGSISSLERYVKCPYSYFLRYGLSIQEPMKLGFPDSYAGTLSHYILETLTNTYGKDYAIASQETIAAILDKELHTLQELFPAMKNALVNVKERLLISMLQTLETLQNFEEHSSLSPSKSEYPFTYKIPIEDDLVLSLHGFIDRIDENKNFACILDYKSSAKTLSKTNIFAALQLQLLTYAMVVAKETNKDILGAYYISLKNENITCTAGKISRRKPTTYYRFDKTDYEEMRKKAQRLNGWTMQKDISYLDDEGTHINGLKMNKDSLVVANKLYDLDVLSTYFEEMYKILAKRILNAEFPCTPQEDACTYCAYHEICRFNGYYEEKTQLIEVNDEIYQKEEKTDA